MHRCSEDQIYALSLIKLKGVCVSLEEAGYTVLNDDMSDTFSKLYGPLIQSGTSSFPSSSQKQLEKLSTDSSSGSMWLLSIPDGQVLSAQPVDLSSNSFRFSIYSFL